MNNKPEETNVYKDQPALDNVVDDQILRGWLVEQSCQQYQESKTSVARCTRRSTG